MNFEPFGAMPKTIKQNFELWTVWSNAKKFFLNNSKLLRSDSKIYTQIQILIERIKNPDCVLTHSYLPIQQEQPPWETKCKNYWTWWLSKVRNSLFQNLKNSFFGKKNPKYPKNLKNQIIFTNLTNLIDVKNIAIIIKNLQNLQNH